MPRAGNARTLERLRVMPWRLRRQEDQSMRDLFTEFRLFWCGVFLLLAEWACPRREIATIQAIRKALHTMPTD